MIKTALIKRGGAYPTTQWSEVARISGADSRAALGALNDLVKKYYEPLRAHLVFKFQVTEDQANDWLQGFLLTKVLLDNLLAHAAEAKGRFRTFLLNSLDNYVFDELRRSNRQCRKPQGGFARIEELGPGDRGELAGQTEDRFAANWARAVIEQVVARMRAECRRTHQARRWEVFRVRVLDPILEGVPLMPYDELVSRFGFQSPAEASNVLITAKRMFHRILRQVVGEYAGDGADVEAEIKELKAILARTS